MSTSRFYRFLPGGQRFETFTVQIKETDLWIAVSRRHYSPDLPVAVEQLVWKQRRLLEAFLNQNPDFAASLEPVVLHGGKVPAIAMEMVRASNRAGVGPMAAVAGTFAEIVGLFLRNHASEVIVENGGDLFIHSVEPVKIGIYAGKSPLSGKIAISVAPEQTPLGICTSSGTVGPSYSRGCADAALAVSPSVPLADAAATALGNLVRGPEDLEKALVYARNLDGVTGALLVCQGQLAAWGAIQLCPMELQNSSL